ELLEVAVCLLWRSLREEVSSADSASAQVREVAAELVREGVAGRDMVSLMAFRVGAARACEGGAVHPKGRAGVALVPVFRAVVHVIDVQRMLLEAFRMEPHLCD